MLPMTSSKHSAQTLFDLTISLQKCTNYCYEPMGENANFQGCAGLACTPAAFQPKHRKDTWNVNPARTDSPGTHKRGAQGSMKLVALFHIVARWPSSFSRFD